MEIKLTPGNDRGFLRSSFADHNGIECRLDESSIATESCIWFGHAASAMHLSQEMVGVLLPFLSHFAATGELIGKEGATGPAATPLEPGSEAVMMEGDSEEQALASIAISMRRIADALDPPDKSRGTIFEQADNWFHNWLGIWMRSR